MTQEEWDEYVKAAIKAGCDVIQYKHYEWDGEWYIEGCGRHPERDVAVQFFRFG
jgi:hypothetical protein